MLPYMHRNPRRHLLEWSQYINMLFIYWYLGYISWYYWIFAVFLGYYVVKVNSLIDKLRVKAALW